MPHEQPAYGAGCPYPWLEHTAFNGCPCGQTMPVPLRSVFLSPPRLQCRYAMIGPATSPLGSSFSGFVSRYVPPMVTVGYALIVPGATVVEGKFHIPMEAALPVD